MKTKISTLFVGFGLAASSLLTTGCIEETFPTSGATEDQLGSSAKATEVWCGLCLLILTLHFRMLKTTMSGVMVR